MHAALSILCLSISSRSWDSNEYQSHCQRSWHRQIKGDIGIFRIVRRKHLHGSLYLYEQSMATVSMRCYLKNKSNPIYNVLAKKTIPTSRKNCIQQRQWRVSGSEAIESRQTIAGLSFAWHYPFRTRMNNKSCAIFALTKFWRRKKIHFLDRNVWEKNLPCKVVKAWWNQKSSEIYFILNYWTYCADCLSSDFFQISSMNLCLAKASSNEASPSLLPVAKAS